MMPDLMREIRKNIEIRAQHVFAVFPDGARTPGFAYTIGNVIRGLPELLIIGSFPPTFAATILNELGDKMREDGRPLPEDLVDIAWTYPFKVRRAGPSARSRFTIQAGQYWRTEDYDVLQVMICDREGRYPGDEGCHPDFDVEQP